MRKIKLSSAVCEAFFFIAVLPPGVREGSVLVLDFHTMPPRVGEIVYYFEIFTITSTFEVDSYI